MNKSTAILLYIILTFTVSVNAQVALEKLARKADFDLLKGYPLSDKYGNVDAVKIVYDIQNKKLYFVNSDFYKYHYEFCLFEQNYKAGLSYFNLSNYNKNENREYLLANINFYSALNKYVLEISAMDLMPTEDIIFLHNTVKNATFVGDSLYFLLNSSRLQSKDKELANKIPIIKPSEIYNKLDYQAISQQSNYGKLRFIENFEAEKNSILPMDIIVLKETPLYLPNVAGIIITEFQTPLSHLSILGQNRKIPIAAYKNAFTDSKLSLLKDKKIKYSVKVDTFIIEAAPEFEYIEKQKNKINLSYNLKVDSLVNIANINSKSADFAGNKAANFGILYKLSKKGGFKTPESAFVIPFYFYDKHIQKSEAKYLINKLLANRNTINNKDSIAIYLKEIRDAIKDSPIDPNLLLAINNKIISLGEFRRMRFRSSTNAEDAKGFSGAGLYTSKTGIVDSEDKPIEKAVKQVWASLWTYEAFMEREYYNINQNEVYMGVLVHRSFPDEEVNGVAITKNIYRPSSFGFTVNVQLGDVKVVDSDASTPCDQFICYPTNSEYIIESKNIVDIITLSRLNNNKLIMTDDEIQYFANQLELIKSYFYSHDYNSKSYLDYGLDIEFKLNGPKRELYIKQVRIYND